MNKNEVILHGECVVFPSAVPVGAKKKNVKGEYVIVADSETSGNHHVVDVVDEAEFFEDENGTLFMSSSKDTQIRCLHAERHSEIKLPAGTYEFGSQQEYDPFAALTRRVRD